MVFIGQWSNLAKLTRNAMEVLYMPYNMIRNSLDIYLLWEGIIMARFTVNLITHVLFSYSSKLDFGLSELECTAMHQI